MSANPLKNCIPFSVGQSFSKAFQLGYDDIEIPSPVDPSGGQWRTLHLSPTTQAGNGPITPISSNQLVLAVQFNERILPGKVRDEYMTRLIADIERREDRKPGKKEYAQLREQAEFELLPKAFIRRSFVYVTFDCKENLMLVHTSSAKKCDDAVAYLNHLFQEIGAAFEPRLLRPKHPVETLTRLASPNNEDGLLVPTDVAVLKGEQRQVVRIKDLEVTGSDVESLLENSYRLYELGLVLLNEGGEHIISFQVNDKFVFKQIALDGIKLLGNKDPEAAIVEFVAFATLFCSDTALAVKTTLEQMGGHVDLKDDGSQEEPDDDEDEL